MSNPLYRYLHKKKSTSHVSRKRKIKVRHHRGVLSVARKRYHRSSHRGLGGGKLMNGIIKPTGLIQSILIGAGTATLIENTGITPLGNMTGVAAGFATAGIGGALGAYARGMLKGTVSGTTVSGSGY